MHGRRAQADVKQAGVTLLEMMVVVGLIAVMIGVTFPAIASGLESLRLRTASQDIVTLLNAALTRANRDQDAVEIVISPHGRSITTQTVRSNVWRKVELPEGIQFARIIPELPSADDSSVNLDDRRLFIYPDGSVPNITVDLINKKGFHRLVAVDPITGVAREQSIAATLVTAQ